jgi:hypothetical protein
VLDIETTGWKSKQGPGVSYTWRSVKHEYQMRLRVTRPGEGDYEVMVAEYLTADQVPMKGSTIPIKVHPERPDIVVLSREEIPG